MTASSLWPYYGPLPTWRDGLTWDAGITWRSVRTVEPTARVLNLDYVRDSILKVSNGNAEDVEIIRFIKAAAGVCEAYTFGLSLSCNPRPQRALAPQTWQMILSGFPASGRIELPRAPVLSVDSVSYYDGDGETQELLGSPADYLLTPSGAYTPAVITPLVDASWPTTATRHDAIAITFQAGYALGGDDNDPQIPEMVASGLCLLVGELYKTRSLSVVGTISQASQLKLDMFWDGPY